MRLGLIDVPTSAGAFAPGQEGAPAALRAAGLVAALERAGCEVHDHGSRAPWPWRPDPDRRDAQNLGAVAEVVRDTAARVRAAAAEDDVTLVLGGDCTVGIGSVAGHVATGERVGLVYLDLHADLNVPASVAEGALDWMGMAHMLAVPGALPELAGAGGRVPLLQPEQVVLLGWRSDQATPAETEAISRHGIATVPVDEVQADPRGAGTRARERLEDRCDRLVVHFDVDVIDFTDAPLSENTGRNIGLPFEAALTAFAAVAASPSLAGVTITELNPDHAAAVPGLVERFAQGLAAAFGGR